jgi:hypothetical protein
MILPIRRKQSPILRHQVPRRGDKNLHLFAKKYCQWFPFPWCGGPVYAELVLIGVMNATTPPATNSDHNYKWILTLLAGFAGGLAPFAINRAEALVGNPELKVKPSLSYIIGMLIFGVIGAVVAALFRELDLKKAFFLGISAPAMISLYAKSDFSGPNGNSSTLTSPWESPVSALLISSAYAQTESPSSSQAVAGRILEIQLNGTMPAATIIFRDAGGNALKTVGITLNEHQHILIPPTAATIVVQYADSVSNPYPLSRTANQLQSIESTGKHGRKDLDISSAFTGQAKILYNIQLSEPSR